MYSPTELNFVVALGGLRHFSNYPQDRKTRCGIPLEGDDWHINKNGFSADLQIAALLSGREDLVEKYDSARSYASIDRYCQHCIEALNHCEVGWVATLEHQWSKKGDGLSWLHDRVFVAQLPKNHVVGWVAVKTKPQQYTYESGGKGGRGLSTQWREQAGVSKTSWVPSRTYDTPTIYANDKNAQQVAEHLLSLKREKGADSISAELELHRTEDIYFLCSENSTSVHFCNFISFTPPPEGVKVQILNNAQLQQINFKELKPVLEPLDDIVEDQT